MEGVRLFTDEYFDHCTRHSGCPWPAIPFTLIWFVARGRCNNEEVDERFLSKEDASEYADFMRRAHHTQGRRGETHIEISEEVEIIVDACIHYARSIRDVEFYEAMIHSQISSPTVRCGRVLSRGRMGSGAVVPV